MPDYVADRVTDIDFDRLAAQGVRCVILDADNTLLSYDRSLPGDDVRKLCDDLKNKGMYVCILSNGHSKRIKGIAAELGLEFIGDALKPRRKGFRICAGRAGCRPEETVLVGDQLFTDIWGARRAGSVAVLVKPIRLDNEPGFVKFKRIFEKHWLKKIYGNTPVIGPALGD